MNDSNFLKILAAAIAVAKPVDPKSSAVTDMDTAFVSANIDSLDMLMISIYMTDIFGVPEEIAKTMMVETPRQMREFLLEHKTIEITDVDKAIADLK